jgi:methylglyoxal synthase
LEKSKRIVLIAHDNKKHDLLEWVTFNKGTLSKHFLSATGTTGKIIHESTGLPIHRFISGPLGGDQQIGSKIVGGEIDIMIFFWDPLSAQPHDPDVKALLRIAVLYNIPMACNRSTADFIISSNLLETEYKKNTEDFAEYSKFIDTENAKYDNAIR